MNKKILLKLILIAIFFAGAIGTGYYFIFSQNKSGNTLSDNLFGWKYPVVKFPITGPNDVAYSDIRDPGGIPEGLPVRLKIPIIGVDSVIEDALITPDGRMDVPSGSVNVAWFALGPKPGKVGSAVIGGHFGIRDGVPFVFYKLDNLKVGDRIYIIDDKDNTLTFVVRSIILFDRNADATTVFTSDDGLAHLNLITCEGIWNRVNDSYPERRVVFTDIMSVGDASVEDASIFFRTLGVGMQGMDVAALQNFLEKKGFLIIPSGVGKGFFGSLTSAAIAKYQTSVGLPSVGVFGPLTKAKVISEAVVVKPSLPSTAITISKFQSIIQSVKILYATPMNGLITSFLIIAIIFMIFKIVRRKNN